MICCSLNQASEWGKYVIEMTECYQLIVLGARQTGLSISETAHLLIFLPTTISSGPENGHKMRKSPVITSSVDKNALLMPEVGGEWPE